MIEAPDYLSPSSIGTFQTCPLKFKYSRIDRLVDPPTEATVLGNFVHSTLELLFTFPAEERTLASAKNAMREVWESEWGVQAVDVLNQNRNALREFRWKAWWCIENYFSLENPWTFEPAGIETGLDGQVGKARVKGFIDRWEITDDNKITISDYKTGKTPRPQWAGDKFQQLFIYAVLLASETGNEVERLNLLYLKDGTVLTRDVTDEALAQTVDAVESVYDSVLEYCEADNFPAVKNKLCDWCSYKTICPAWARKR